jgi:hypothetical protein
MSEVRKVYVPCIREEQANQVYDDQGMPTGEILPFDEVIKTNLCHAVNAGISVLNDDDTVIYFCVSQKTETGHVMTWCGTCLKDNQEVEFVLPEIVLPKVTLTGKQE